MQWAVIMAGGNGMRFWPLSSDAHPKQFLKLIGDRSPARCCLDRLKRFIAPERILIVASELHRQALEDDLPDFPTDQVLWEPIGRNTAPCIAWACETIRQRDPEAIIGVFPSDHDITDEKAFVSCARAAYKMASGHIVLFGIEPTRPETGYGYIETGAEIKSKHQAYEVASFREKPDSKTAQQYIDEGRFLWNSGMFIFDAQTMHEELELHVPQILSGIEDILSGDRTVEEAFCRLTSISIDYAVMEHTKRARVIRARFPWDDLGTWESIARYYERDQDGNAASGRVVIADSKNVFVMNKTPRVVGVLGLKDITVVSSEDGILVMDSSCSQDVRQLAIVVRFLGPAKSEKKRNDEKSS